MELASEKNDSRRVQKVPVWVTGNECMTPAGSQIAGLMIEVAREGLNLPCRSEMRVRSLPLHQEFEGFRIRREWKDPSARDVKCSNWKDRLTPIASTSLIAPQARHGNLHRWPR